MREKIFILVFASLCAFTRTVVASDCPDGDCGLPESVAQVEEILDPQMPTGNLWMNDMPMVSTWDAGFTEKSCDSDFIKTEYCPFDTEIECEIWRTKPTVREVVAPRSKQIQSGYMDDFLAVFSSCGEIDGNHPAAAPFLGRYKMLMQSARACCTEGINYSLRASGASDGLIYKYMVDDANFYNMYDRCLMTNDANIIETYQDGKTAKMTMNVRNECLCRGRAWFTAMLSPFIEAWRLSPDFAASKFYWTYKDGVGRPVDVSINDDVETVLNLLKQCP